MPQEDENWNPEAVWKHLRYRTKERWLDEQGSEFRPYTHYCVGGNTKFWGSVLYRLRREDFQAVEHADGISPAWPIDYDTLEPFYDRAERLYHVHGQQGVDPTEPPRGPFPYDADSALGRDGGDRRRAAAAGAASLAAAARPDAAGRAGGCILCNTCNSFPCKLHAKSEADVCCVRQAIAAAERDAVDQRLRASPDHRCRAGEQRRGRRGRAERRDASRRSVAVRRLVRRGQLGGAAAALGERRPSRWPGELVRARRASATWRIWRR